MTRLGSEAASIIPTVLEVRKQVGGISEANIVPMASPVNQFYRVHERDTATLQRPRPPVQSNEWLKIADALADVNPAVGQFLDAKFGQYREQQIIKGQTDAIQNTIDSVEQGRSKFYNMGIDFIEADTRKNEYMSYSQDEFEKRRQAASPEESTKAEWIAQTNNAILKDFMREKGIDLASKTSVFSDNFIPGVEAINRANVVKQINLNETVKQNKILDDFEINISTDLDTPKPSNQTYTTPATEDVPAASVIIPADTETYYKQKAKNINQKIEALIVSIPGLSRSHANDMVVKSVIQKAEATGDYSQLDILKYMDTAGGNLSTIPKYQLAMDNAVDSIFQKRRRISKEMEYNDELAIQDITRNLIIDSHNSGNSINLNDAEMAIYDKVPNADPMKVAQYVSLLSREDKSAGKESAYQYFADKRNPNIRPEIQMQNLIAIHGALTPEQFQTELKDIDAIREGKAIIDQQPGAMAALKDVINDIKKSKNIANVADSPDLAGYTLYARQSVIKAWWDMPEKERNVISGNYDAMYKWTMEHVQYIKKQANDNISPTTYEQNVAVKAGVNPQTPLLAIPTAVVAKKVQTSWENSRFTDRNGIFIPPKIIALNEINSTQLDEILNQTDKSAKIFAVKYPGINAPLILSNENIGTKIGNDTAAILKNMGYSELAIKEVLQMMTLNNAGIKKTIEQRAIQSNAEHSRKTNLERIEEMYGGTETYSEPRTSKYGRGLVMDEER